MNYHAHRSRLWLFATGVILLLALLLPSTVLAHGPSDGGASRGDINSLFTIIFWMAVPVFLLVEGLILFAIFRYRRRHNEEMPEQVEGNIALELTWTILSFIIIAIVFLLTYRFMTTEYEAEAQNETGEPELTVHVEGYMFNWDYTYFLGDGIETGVRTTRTLTIPADRLVRLEVTSRDVQHSFWLPELAGKIDAIPGYTNDMWLNVEDPGFYKGNCAEFCGTLHYDMIIELDVLPGAEFDAWLAEEQAEAAEFTMMGKDMESELPEGDAERGAALFAELNCAACHGESAGAGPAFSDLGNLPEEEELGETREYHLREGILMPCEYEVEGYSCAMMPTDYGEKLDEQGLADLIEYLLQN